MKFATNNQTLSREQAEALLREPRSKIAIDIETVSLVNTLPLGIDPDAQLTQDWYVEGSIVRDNTGS